jgi:flavin-dependent dehydrogenase
MTPKKSPHELRVDVAVLGGGPAGASAARLLALWGHRVMLLTRPAPGPPLAESLTPSCAKVLERVGVLDAINRAAFIRSTGHTVRWGTADERVEQFADGALGWQLSRDALDRVLLREAKAAGALVHRHASVREVAPAGEGASRVSYEERGHAKYLEARWVIDCTGRSGLMSRAESGHVAAGPRTVAIVGLWERRPRWPLADESHTHVESYPGGWAWSVPLSKTRRQVTVMLDPSRTDIAGGSRLRMTYREEIARTTMIRAMIERARFLGSPWARDASSYESGSPSRRHLLVAGDAASFVDPLSSYGVKKAMASAWLAAVVVHSVIGDPSLEGPALDLFAARERAMVAGLKRQLAQFSREASEAHPVGFWDDRAGVDVADVSTDPDVAMLRSDADVRAAFDAIRSRPSLVLRLAAGVRRERRAMVVGHTISLADHFVIPAFPGGIRFVRNVDLILLAELAPKHDDAAALFDAYNAAASPVPLPDYLGALAVLVGKGVLVLG